MDNKEGSMNEFLENYDVKRINPGDILKGRVIDVNETCVTVNINYAFDGLIEKQELSYDDISPMDILKKDDELDVYVISPNDGEGYVRLSRIRALQITEKEDIREAFAEGKILSVKVKESVKGGVVAYYGTIRIFIPGSQASRERIELETLIGKTLDIKIIELDFKNRKVIGSRRVIEEEEYEKVKEKAWDSITPGEKRTGIVKSIVKYGAFVDIGGIEGLIHINDLSWERVNKVEDVLSISDRVEVFIGEVDREKNRISLILKDIAKEPWNVYGDSIKEGQILDGKVARCATFGAFVEVYNGITGLVHISEITDENIAKPEDVLEIGQSIKVKVLSIDKENKKLSLSIKEADVGNKDYEAYNDNDGGVSLKDLFSSFNKE